MLQKGVKKAWGPKPTYIRWIYTAILQPKLTYAALLWGHSTRFDNKHTALATTLIAPVRLSTPVKTMEILYNHIPLHLYIRYEAIASLSRNTHYLPTTWPGQNSFCK